MLVPIRTLAVGLLSLAVAVGCATPGHVRAVKTADRLEELRASIEEMQSLATATATALADVLARKDQDPAQAFQKLESTVHALDGAQRRAKSRLAAVRAQADQYFVTWKEQAATIKDEDLKETSEERCTKLTAAVERVENSLTPGFEAVETYLATFRDTVKYLSIELTPSSIESIGGRSKDASKSAKSIHSKLGSALEVVTEAAPLFAGARTSASRTSGTGTPKASGEINTDSN